MKLHIETLRRGNQGHALLLVLSLTAVVLLMLTGTMNRTKTDVALNARNNQYQASLYAAEAATEEVVARVKQDFLSGNLTWVTNNLYNGTYQRSVPLTSQNSYWGNFQFTDGLGHSGSNYVMCLFSQGWSPLRSQYEGLSGWTNHLYIVANAKQLNSMYDITAAVQQDIEMDLVPVFQFAIFYNSLLEFTWCAPFTVNGRTHANGDIYTGSSSSLTFNSLVDTTGSVSSPAWFGKTAGQYTSPTIYNATYKTNSNSLVLPIGTSNNAAAVREIINMPPASGDTNSALAAQRYYNKAGIVLLVSNTTITAIIRSPSNGTTNVIKATYNPVNNNATNYSQITSNFPFLSVTNYWATNPVTMTDQRENDVLKLTEIDVSVLKTWLTNRSEVNNKFPNTAGVYPSQTNAPNILYVADNRNYNNGQMTAVRLRNGTNLPPNYFVFTGTNTPSGFTVATPNPLYIYGHYNTPDPSQRGTTNTSAAYPASLVSDSLTILSPNWQDSQSTIAVGKSSSTSAQNGKNAAVSTTVNAAVLTGVVYSTGADVDEFSGGVHNLPRLLEDWGNGSSTIKLTLNTSIVNLFNSVRATNQFQAPGKYYYAPTRQFSFDPNFLLYYKQPPGTPMLSYVIRSKWSTPAPGTTNYAGF